MAKRKQRATFTEYVVQYRDAGDQHWLGLGAVTHRSIAKAREYVKDLYFDGVSTEFRIVRRVVSPHEILSWEYLNQDVDKPTRKGNLVWA